MTVAFTAPCTNISTTTTAECRSSCTVVNLSHRCLVPRTVPGLEAEAVNLSGGSAMFTVQRQKRLTRLSSTFVAHATPHRRTDRVLKANPTEPIRSRSDLS